MPPFRPLSFALICALMLTCIGSAQSGFDPMAVEIGQGPLHTVVVSATDTATRARLAQSGAIVRSYEYGAFDVYRVDEAKLGGREALLESGLTFRDELDLIPMNGYVIDGTRPGAIVDQLDPAESFAPRAGEAFHREAGLYLVKFESFAKDAWLDELRAAAREVIQYVPMNAWVVRADRADVVLLEELKARQPALQAILPYHPALKMTPEIRAVAVETETVIPVIIQVVGEDSGQTLEDIRKLASTVHQETQVGPYTNVHADVSAGLLRSLAASRNVFAIERRHELVLLDEIQGQIVAGNITGGLPNGPGYLNWLTSMGFDATQFSTFAVNVVDDSSNLMGHPDLPASRVAFQFNPVGGGATQGGHGFLNSHIIGGDNVGVGFPNEDGAGFNYGMGIAPFARVGVTRIFPFSSSASSTAWEDAAYGAGARISTNSWGQQSFGSAVADYNARAQEYDFIVRDAQGGVAGNQELAVYFSAGNFGPGTNSVSSPSTAKNVMTVGAAENVRQTGTDGCGISNSGADNAEDIIGFSSRGPVAAGSGDGRSKPDIQAPGTHIQAGIPQSNYAGNSVCDAFHPAGQTLYGWSSGTSHSCPAVAAGAMLCYQWFLNNGLPAPSPAMQKAFLMATSEYMTGTGANDTLPSPNQGMGRMNLGRSFENAGRIIRDQQQVLSAAGQQFVVTGTIADNTAPTRITLAWTDVPGPTSGAPYVNDLDLTVTYAGQTYVGNVFSGANSTTGGSADFRNNVESVFLPPGLFGAVTVTVTATAINGDGVPGNADLTDQDFALYIHNLNDNGPPVANFTGSPTQGVAPVTTTFSDQSFGQVSSWAWNFGDGGTSTQQDPTHTYTAAGVYDVSLTVTGPFGSNTLTRSAYIDVAPPPAFTINLPGGVPTSVEPDVASAVHVTTSDLAGTVNPASGLVFFSIDGAPFTSRPLEHVSGSDFLAVLPGAACFSTIDFYIELVSADGLQTIRSPFGAPASTHSTTSLSSNFVTVIDDDFETNQGWTVSNDAGLIDGAWERGTPAGGGTRGDPPSDFDGSGQCFVTDNVSGNSDVDGGSTTLTSPALNLSGLGDAMISYAFWFDNEFGANPNTDTFEIEISNDGVTWLTVESYNANANDWVSRSHRVADLVTPTANVRMRFIASDPAPDGSVVEAGVDAFKVEFCPPTQGMDPTCSAGVVGANNGGPFDVLLVNGSSGGTTRIVDAPVGAPFTVSMIDPPGSPNANFVIWGFLGTSSPADVTPITPDIGTMCFPICDVSPNDPRLFTLANTFGGGVCPPLTTATPTDWTLVGGVIPFPITFELQGAIAETSPTPKVSVTNAIRIVVQ